MKAEYTYTDTYTYAYNESEKERVAGADISGGDEAHLDRAAKLFDIFFSLLRLTPANDRLLGSSFAHYLVPTYNCNSYSLPQGGEGFQLISSLLGLLPAGHLNEKMLHNLVGPARQVRSGQVYYGVTEGGGYLRYLLYLLYTGVLVVCLSCYI